MTGEELRTLRQTKGWSQRKLAQEAGIDAANINDYETGRKGITRLAASFFTRLLCPSTPDPGTSGPASASFGGESPCC